LVDHLEFRRLLLVLDNCEHVVGAVSPLVELLLRRCPGVVVLATSREPLGIAGEVVQRLGPLDLPRSDESLDAVQQCSAVRLFADRARLRRRDLIVDEATAPTVAAICRAVDGVPYAIELAAAQVGVLALPQIVAMLDDQLGALAPGRQGSPSRRPTLRDMIDWSFERLTEREQQLLLRLSVFVGGFTLEAARAVGAGGELAEDEVTTVLASLVDKCLVEPDTGQEANRFRLLEVTRQYAAHRLDERGARVASVLAHRRWFTALAERGAEGLAAGDQARWLGTFDADYDNLIAACSYDAAIDDELGNADETLAAGACDAGERAGLRIASCMAHYWLIRGRLSEGREILAEALDRHATPNDDVRGRALVALALLGAFGGWFEEGERAAKGAIEIAAANQSVGVVARASTLLGLIENGTGRAIDAERHHRSAVDGARTAGDRWAESFALTNLGNVLARRGATAEAEAVYLESIEIRRARNDDWGLSWALFRLGSLYLWEARLDEADELLTEARSSAERLDYQQGGLLALLAGGDVAFARGATADASTRYEEALTAARQLEQPSIGCMALAGLANAALAEGRVEAAVRWLGEEDTLRSGLTMATLAALLSAQAEVAAALDQFDVSDAGHRDVLDVRREIGDRRGLLLGLEDLAGSAARTGGLDRAAFLLGAAARGRQEMGGPVPPVRRARLEELAKRITADPDEAVQAAWRQGLQASLDDALAVATG
jgi:predicted ATPase